jgi:GntR family transcriptional regulator/MocR family aminotransferase
LVANALLEPGDHAWVESPGYGGANVAFQAAGAIVSGIQLDSQGMAISSHKETPRLIFVTPSHQYPTGRLMPIGRRLELLRFAETAGACIIEDDYDGEFHYEARPVAALQGLAPSPRVFYLGTFSKATYADIRIGYVVVPEALIDIFELAQRQMGILTSITIQDALAEFINAGAYLGHIRRMTRLYRGRRDRMLQALATETGNRLAVETPAGGMQLLARCRPQTNDQQLSARLLEAGVVSRALTRMLYHKTEERGLFLGFAAWNDKEIDQAARILGRIVR